ncbi:hypothetical protein [Staphylococcus phage vB_SauR_SW21]|nr:hypothetical protein [Staphylococcus phage vB_SauR_SW21]
MKITTTLNTNKLINYILTNRECFINKITKFTSLSEKCVVFVLYGNIYIEYYDNDNDNDNDTKNKNDLFTLEIDIDVRTHSFNYLNVFYREHLNPLYKKEAFMDCTIDDVLECFEKPLESYITIIFQNKVIYANGKVIDHE